MPRSHRLRDAVRSSLGCVALGCVALALLTSCSTGTGTPAPNAASRTPGPSGPTSGWVQVSAGVDHTCGVRADGTAWCWGSNLHGQLGDGTNRDSSVPVEVAAVPGYEPDTGMGSRSHTVWEQISAGSMDTCAIRSDHTAWCWGDASFGQLGTSQVNGGYGTDASIPHQVRDPFDAPLMLTTIDTGDRTSCGIGESGLALCWGWSDVGQGTTDGADISPVAQSGYYFHQIASDGAHTCAIARSHSLWCWGSAAYGETGNGQAADDQGGPAPIGTATDWTLVSPGTRFTCGLRSPGTAWCFGLNDRGQLGTSGPSVRVTPSQVGGVSSWTGLDSGGSHVCGIQSSGSLWCWGEDRDGELGIGRTSNLSVPTRVGTGSTWVQVSSGDRHSCAVAGDGKAWCWGSNGYGQLGDGTTTSRWHPVVVGSPRNGG